MLIITQLVAQTPAPTKILTRHRYSKDRWQQKIMSPPSRTLLHPKTHSGRMKR